MGVEGSQDVASPKTAESEVPGDSSIDEKMEELRLMERSGNHNMGEAVGSKENVDGVSVVGIFMDSSVGGGEFRVGSNGSMMSVKGYGVSDVCLASDSINVSQEREDESSKLETDDSEEDSSSSDELSSSSASSEQEEEEADDENNKCGKRDEMVDVEGGERRDLDQNEVVMYRDEDAEVMRKPVKSKHETEVLPPVPHVEVFLQPHHQTLSVGVISSILGTRVIIEGSEKHNPLNEGSILWITETRSLLGIVDEIFGPVRKPYYVVRYNSAEEVAAGISVGTCVSAAIELVNHIPHEKDLYKKGCDASDEYDEEVTGEVDFSDDEKEAEYKRSLQESHWNQEAAIDEKMTNSTGAPIGKFMQPPVPCALPAMGQPLPSVPVSLEASPVTTNVDCCISTSSVGDENESMSAPHTVPETPPQQHQLGIQRGYMTVLPSLYLNEVNRYANAIPYQQQFIPNRSAAANMIYYASPPVPNSFPSTMPYQQQDIPNCGATANMQWSGGPLNPCVGPTSHVPVGQFNVGQAPFGYSNMYGQGTSGSYNAQSYGQPPIYVQGTSGSDNAQSYGQPPMYVQETSGSYNAQSYGQSPMYVQETSGSYNAQSYRQPPIYVQETSGSYNAQSYGQPPMYVQETSGSYNAQSYGQSPMYVQETSGSYNAQSYGQPPMYVQRTSDSYNAQSYGQPLMYVQGTSGSYNAQSYGQPPMYVQGTSGSYNVQSYGQPPMYVQGSSGSYNAQSYGQPLMYVQGTSGSYNAQSYGQPPMYVEGPPMYVEGDSGSFNAQSYGQPPMYDQGASDSYNAQSYGQPPPATVQDGMPPPRQFNRGRSSSSRVGKPYKGGGRHSVGWVAAAK